MQGIYVFVTNLFMIKIDSKSNFGKRLSVVVLSQFYF